MTKKARYVGGKTDSTAPATRLSAERFLIIKDILNPESTLTSHNCGSKEKVSLYICISFEWKVTKSSDACQIVTFTIQKEDKGPDFSLTNQSKTAL